MPVKANLTRFDLTADVPDEEWDKLPADLAEHHDHYLYGTPKSRPTV